MFHAQIGCFYQCITIFPERIFTQILFVTTQHGFHLIKLNFRFIHIIAHHIIIQRQSAFISSGIFIMEVFIVTHIQSNVISVYRIAHKPVESAGSIRITFFRFLIAVGYTLKPEGMVQDIRILSGSSPR